MNPILKKPPMLPPRPHSPQYYNNEEPSAFTLENKESGSTQAPGPYGHWIPSYLSSKLGEIPSDFICGTLLNDDVLRSLTYGTETANENVVESRSNLKNSIEYNVLLASNILKLEQELMQMRAIIQTQLLATHALERQWKQKQVELDTFLEPFSPSSLYARLSSRLQEQLQRCLTVENHLLRGDGHGDKGFGLHCEREIQNWISEYIDTKRLAYLQQERKNRWDEGRVGGWH